MRRLLKYHNKGYAVEPETLTKVMEAYSNAPIEYKAKVHEAADAFGYDPVIFGVDLAANVVVEKPKPHNRMSEAEPIWEKEK